ncbi:MAG: DNA pilot protein [Microviridae sp.]|nr:MAG: DNA pilot protein [Microviridae sp.]
MGLLGSIGSLFGPVFGGIGAGIDGMMAQDSAENFSSSAAQANRDFQERMSNTAWQRGMNDMRAAGLNPMLAVSQGPAGVPGGSAASFPGAVGAQYEQSSASGVSAQAATRQAETSSNIAAVTIDKIKQEVNNLETTNKQIFAVIDNLNEQRQNLIKEGYNLSETGNVLRATVDKLKAEVPKLNSETFVNAARELLVQAQASLAKGQTSLLGLDLKAAEDLGNFGREAGQLRPLIDVLKMFVPRPR